MVLQLAKPEIHKYIQSCNSFQPNWVGSYAYIKEIKAECKIIENFKDVDYFIALLYHGIID